MNIFFLDENPSVAARHHCDAHVVKMVLETAQIMSAAHHVIDGDDAPTGIYKKTHANHPCAVWVRQSAANYEWTRELFGALLEEYEIRYKRQHKTGELWPTLSILPSKLRFCTKSMNVAEVPQAMPDEYRVVGDPVTAYRRYYANAKTKMSRFGYRFYMRPIPAWIAEHQIHDMTIK